jgi:hypothetical protein
MAVLSSLLDHVPPEVASESVVDIPTHADAVPVIALIGLTVTTTVALQPVGII